MMISLFCPTLGAKTRLALTVLLLGLGAAPALSCALPEGGEAARAAVLAGVNQARAKSGLGALQIDQRLQKAAQAHACESAARDRMGHDSRGGAGPADRAARSGYPIALMAENVGQGFRNGDSAVSGWMGSKGHRSNILQRRAEDAGIGIARAPGSGKLHWVLMIGREG